jgi:uncharacterized membrane protein YuzA (DUF378 family)
MDRIALVFTVLGALNWGCVGIFKFDFISWAFGGSASTGSRIIYTLIALAGLWCVSLLFRHRDRVEDM